MRTCIYTSSPLCHSEIEQESPVLADKTARCFRKGRAIYLHSDASTDYVIRSW